MNKAELVEAVLHLPRQERAEIAAAVLHSLDDDLPPLAAEEWDAAWQDEISRRLQAIDRGEVTAIPAKQAFDDIRAGLAGKWRGG